MANPEHLAILKQGVEAWNAWREQHPDVVPDLSEVDLAEANLSKNIFSSVNLKNADLRRANLTGNLIGADLSGAVLIGADFFGSYCRGMNLTRANLTGCHFTSVDLQGANFTNTTLGQGTFREIGRSIEYARQTAFLNIDFRGVQGLDTIRHRGPSTIGIDTLYLSGGNIPESFLRGCGVPESMIEYAHSLVVRPIEFYSCFISYSSADDALAHRLHADLQAAGVRCWFAPHDLKIGESIIDSIDQSIKLHEKLLLILSESAVTSSWVGLEVKTAIMREQRENRRVLFPIRLDDAVLHSTAGWAGQVNERHIGDFRQWKDHDSYQAAFHRLLRDLKAKRA